MDFYRNREANVERLLAAYPDQFSTKQNIGFAWPDGWHDLVSGVCEWMETNSPSIRWLQIKEKFGGLRMYYIDGPMIADDISKMITIIRIPDDYPNTALVQPVIDLAASRSAETCMGCGGPGQRKVHERYVYTACDDCLKPDAQ